MLRVDSFAIGKSKRVVLFAKVSSGNEKRIDIETIERI